MQARYRELPYRTGAFRLTHPARLGAIARLLGGNAAEPQRARVLELGCGCGLNLLPLAAMLPEAQFRGVDLTAPDIEEGRRLAAAAGVTNLRLEVADVRAFVPAAEDFDFVIAHGLFSHVPDDAKAAILASCARALAPDGVAYISYNTYPGWKARETLRDLLALRLRGVEGVDERLANARATLAFLRAALATADKPQAMALLSLVADMEKKDPMVFYHDELGPFNDPCYLLQFVEWAEEHGLRYLGDAQLSLMTNPNLPEETAAAFAAVAPETVQGEQMMDFVVQQTFRCSLLTRASEAKPRAWTPDALRGCVVGSQLRAGVAVPDLREGQRVRFTHPKGAGLETGDAATKALLAVLAAAWPRRVAFAEAVAATRRLLASAGIEVPAALEAQAVSVLFDLVVRQAADFLLSSGLDCATKVPAMPRVDAVARTLAASGLAVANRWHENVALTPPMRALAARLDGTVRPTSAEESEAAAALSRAGLVAADARLNRGIAAADGIERLNGK
ncbi:MAG TPA: methyltransferase regulatory domain-containing protein [Opitutus sp.]|nr:methyltransferase regulatory domain-containing protein [Opitutus sp.]